MPEYTQKGRPMRVATPLGEDVLLLDRFAGVEGISRPFALRLELLSEDAALSADDMLRQPAHVTVDLPGGETRVLHGLVRSFTQLGQRDDLTAYRAELVPWLWFLSLTRDTRIFQDMTVLEIVEQVFADHGYSDFDFRCTRSYPKREYCVQYRESGLDFVSRLLEDEGIFYFFQHSDADHVLVLADDNSAVKPCPGYPSARIAFERAPEEDAVLSFEDEHQVHTGKVTLTDYDYLQPSLSLRSSVSANGGNPEEVYDYPGGYMSPEEGDRYALLRLEQREAERNVVRGRSSCRAFVSGYRFDLKEHYRRDLNRAYMLLEVYHTGSAGDYRAWTGGGRGATLDYQNEFTAIPYDVPFRPATVTPRPVARGSQTALVVGPSGEEIWVDSHGRVKVQFHWDRAGKKDENSSCWVRVSSSWAGKGWGWIQIPRIGQEVVVDFLDGDPDRPIITGRVYNAEQVPPYDLPGNQTQSGVKSRSSKGGSPETFNEIRFEDKKDGEQFYVHAEKDMEVVVENDRAESVGNDETISVGNDQSVSIAKNRTESVGEDETVSVAGKRTMSVDKDESLTVGGSRTKSVSKDENVDVGGKRSTSVAKDETVSVGDKRATQVGKDDQLQVGKKLVIDAGDQIVLKSGKGSITIKKDGSITIKGKDVKIDASGKINGKASSNIVLKGSKVTQN